jgi:redox-sensitive bicupin YhaK (pirin superfamily)
MTSIKWETLCIMPSMSSSIARLLEPEEKDLGGFNVRRILPHKTRQMVGPFIFFDHLGPSVFPAGKGVDVRPHPHIGLATVTYLFEGVLMHRDSLGSVQEIHPGAVNWMTAGQGIVHSERTPDSVRAQETTLHGIQTWVALPTEAEETEPWFRNYEACDLPIWESGGVSFKLIAGQAYGHRSPVQTFSPMIYLEVKLSPDSPFILPADYSERAIYSLDTELIVDGVPIEPHRLAILTPERSIEVSAKTAAHCVIIGGDPVGERHKGWNFVSSRPEQIEQAKLYWQHEQFAKVLQETEFIPLPEDIL